jgi:hypothetical protein
MEIDWAHRRWMLVHCTILFPQITSLGSLAQAAVIRVASIGAASGRQVLVSQVLVSYVGWPDTV